jgi:hypothetical protein
MPAGGSSAHALSIGDTEGARPGRVIRADPREDPMNEGEAIYLGMVITSMSLFAITLFMIAQGTNNRK